MDSNSEFYERFFGVQELEVRPMPRPTDFKIHCSAIQSIMATPKAPNSIPVGAQTVVEHWFKSTWYGKRQYNATVATLKGTAVEWDVVRFIASVHDQYYEKNERTYSNEFLVGTPDIAPTEIANSDFLIDLKSPEDCFSFPLFEDELPKIYEWQMQGYLHLTGRKYARVIYALVTAPDHLIEKKARQIARDQNENYSQELFDAVKKNMTYDHLPASMRIKEYRVDYDPKKIEQIEQRVKDCRQWLTEKLIYQGLLK